MEQASLYINVNVTLSYTSDAYSHVFHSKLLCWTLGIYKVGSNRIFNSERITSYVLYASIIAHGKQHTMLETEYSNYSSWNWEK